MVWGIISYARKTQLVPIQGNVSAARYRDGIIQPHLLPDIDVRGEIFQQDCQTRYCTFNYGLLAKSEHCCYLKHMLLFNKKQLDRTQVSQLRNVFSNTYMN